MEKKTHWKKTSNPNYLGSWDLEDDNNKFQQLTLTIKSVVQEEVMDPATSKTKIETVCHFVEKYKPMILNETNKKAIATSTKSNYIEDWVGKKIAIKVEKVKAFGDIWDALRVSPRPVVTEPPKKCACCGKEISASWYNKSVEKYGVGVCSAECRDQMTGGQENGCKADAEGN